MFAPAKIRKRSAADCVRSPAGTGPISTDCIAVKILLAAERPIA
jgi:hypothetical protein